MNDFLPSRKVTAFILVPIVTIFGLWAVLNYYNQPEVVSATDEKSSLEIALAEGDRLFQEQDTDGDGLKDWEEFLYQTDERNPDTDGDGSSDGLEVQRGFDPLIAGTGSADDVEAEKSSGVTFYKNDPNLSRTDLLARDIFVAYRELKEGEALELTEIRDKAIQRSLNESTRVENEYTYVIEDITRVQDAVINARTYKQSYDQAVRGLALIQFTELELFERYISDNDLAALSELIKNKQRYETFAEEFSKASVPEPVVQVHLELINNVMILANTIGNMALIEEDPVGAFVYARKSIEDENLISQNLDALSLYFRRNNL